MVGGYMAQFGGWSVARPAKLSTGLCGLLYSGSLGTGTVGRLGTEEGLKRRDGPVSGAED